jgi:mono/diheme cytochrome c family protein
MSGWKERLTNWNPGFSPKVYRFILGTMLTLAFVIPLAIVALPFIEFLNGMAAQPKAKSQMTYGRIFGQQLPVWRPEPLGAVRQDYQPILFEAGTNKIEDATALGAKVVNPIPMTMDNLRRGQDRFDIYCIVCHGPGAEGNGSVVGPNRFPAPPSLHTDQARGYADGTICYIITRGTGKMPSYAGQLGPDDRWKVVHYVRALQRAHNPKPEDLKP